MTKTTTTKPEAVTPGPEIDTGIEKGDREDRITVQFTLKKSLEPFTGHPYSGVEVTAWVGRSFDPGVKTGEELAYELADLMQRTRAEVETAVQEGIEQAILDALAHSQSAQEALESQGVVSGYSPPVSGARSGVSIVDEKPINAPSAEAVKLAREQGKEEPPYCKVHHSWAKAREGQYGWYFYCGRKIGDNWCPKDNLVYGEG